MGKQAHVITPDLAPTMYSWINGFKTITAYERAQAECDVLIDDADVLFMMDYNTLSRIKSLGEKLKTFSKTKVLVDHHLDPDIDVDVFFSDPNEPATCSYIFKILCEAGLKEYISIEAVTNFYTGIMTDTGGLSYNSSSSDIYYVVADLLNMGVDKPKVHDKIFNNKFMKQLRLLGFTLGHRMSWIPDLPLTVMALSADDLERFNYNTGDTEGFVNYPLQVRNVVANVLILERPDCVKISIRSKGEFPVNEFAAKYFGGGGHLNAAGCTYFGKFEDAVRLYKENIKIFYTEWLAKQGK
jgi:phosphoesterase RecJ-like protein